MLPSYNQIEMSPEEIRVILRRPGESQQMLASGSWQPPANVRFYPELSQYVRYDRLPF